MKIKKEYLFLLIAIVALTAYLATRSKNRINFELPQLVEVENQKFNRMEITKNGNTIELNKKDDQWTIGPKAYAADSIKVKNMVKALADAKVTSMISDSKDYDRYDLADDKKVHVRAYADDAVLRDLDIGSAAPTNMHTFVKLDKDPNVYYATGSIDKTFNVKVDDLRDETVLTYQKDDIKAVTVSQGEHSVNLSRKEVTIQEEKASSEEKKEKKDGAEENKDEKPKTEIQWSDAEGTPAAKADVDKLIGDFAKLKCERFLADDAKAGLKDPLWSVTLNSEKEAFTLSVYNKEKEDSTTYPATSSASPYAFNLSKSRIETFQKGMDKLLKKPEPAKDEKKAEEKKKVDKKSKKVKKANK